MKNRFSPDSMNENEKALNFIGEALNKLGSVLVTMGLLMFGLIFIIAPGLAANLGMFCAACLADE
ncbi:MAG: hypothetical protein ABRQ26_05495 [Syntrophomonadaceae bacterium]